MNDTGPPTNPGDIEVTGQRRRPGGSFPTGGGGGGSDGPGRVLIGDDGGPLIVPDYVDPCEIPELRLEWNADAAAAAAAAEMARLAALAGENGLETKERGAFLYLGPNGDVLVGPIRDGTAYADGDAHVLLTYDGVNIDTIIGTVHSHSAGNHRPSGPSPRPGLGDGDIGAFNSLRSLLRSQGRDPGILRDYIVARNQLGAGETPYNQINVYTEGNYENSIANFEDDPEVNPQAQPCP